MEITKEQIAFLTELGAKMNAQNNRATQYPLFIVQTLVKTYHSNGENRERTDEPPEGSVCADCSKAMASRDDTPNPDCDACDQSAFDYFDEQYVAAHNVGVFFTVEECEAHIKANSYHYVKPRSYAVSAWRNYEMQKVMRILSALGSSDGEPVSFYE